LILNTHCDEYVLTKVCRQFAEECHIEPAGTHPGISAIKEILPKLAKEGVGRSEQPAVTVVSLQRLDNYPVHWHTPDSDDDEARLAIGGGHVGNDPCDQRCTIL